MTLSYIDAIQLILTIICLFCIFSYIAYSFKSNIKLYKSLSTKCSQTTALNYKEYMTVEDYTAYEKFHIWRFYVHF
ncbi:hypothetical protein CLPU_23c00310 [Gottschalkia purinilytica]|uniref:Uncharacterized protein n=1 Tax=Gottschalkia purinilytica TaxID=1503 RepID=A0A0L0W6L3_GOTPU|nr:hypothetical protein CLPU_23c00310 [Gottschalkia purinilytica]